MALEQAQLCNPQVLAYADFIAQDPVHEPLAWHLRMVKHLYSGEATQARACRDRTELLALRHPEGVPQLAASVLELEAEHARLQYTRGGNPLLMGKHQRLLADARRTWSEPNSRPTARPPGGARRSQVRTAQGSSTAAPSEADAHTPSSASKRRD